MKPGITIRLVASTTAAASPVTAMLGRTWLILPSSISTSAWAKSPTARSSESTMPPLMRTRRAASSRVSSASPCACAVPLKAGRLAPSAARPALACRKWRREATGVVTELRLASALTRSLMTDLALRCLRLADQHGGDPGHDRQRDRYQGAQPDHARRHHVDLPVEQPLDRIERPRRRIGDHLGGAGATLERRRPDREPDHGATRRSRAKQGCNRDAEHAGARADPGDDEILRHHGCDVAGADHANQHARNQHHEVTHTLIGAFAEQRLAAHRRDECQRRDQQPQDDADDDGDDGNEAHWSPPQRRAAMRAAARAMKPAMTGSGSASTMRQPTNSGPKNGSSQIS